MKITKYIMLFCTLCGFVGCQTIGEKEQLVPVDKESIRSNRTTLICEFSGYLCTNCPNAAEEAHSMLEFWGKNLVVVEMHPASNSFTRWTKEEYDYTCEAADIYYKSFGGLPTTGLPTGVINMSGGFTDYPLWGGAYVSSAVAQTKVQLSAETTYDKATRTLNTTVDIVNLQQEQQDLSLVAWITEDSILGGQKMPDGSTNKEYYHNHLLRDTMTAVWGEPFSLQGEKHMALKPYELSEKLVAKHCHVVLLALRGKEVVQALQVAVTK